ncbi:alpha-ketoglutarate-dependent dioxygenase alkB homolog 4 [Amyelois transitella]|uniref:alpha-ketoglutarate-dependent dioxygenase alkB homolog 4 n=1 Tax=Amyelois transitella TaxID=680683 RepID=UPI00298FE1FF|nr:alpha-ketoglutarate-dependent dioxygenase alkB homolog 4 [Amyelois transitella]
MTKPRPCGCKGCRTCLICETQYGAEKFKQQFNFDKDRGYVYCPKCNKAWRGWDPNLYKEHPNHQGDSIDYPGVYILLDFINEVEEDELMQNIDEMPWDISQSGRRKQNFGPKTNFKKKKIVSGKFDGFPAFSKFLQDRFNAVDMLKHYETIEQCSLEYDPSKGASIDPHIDDCWIWGERIVTVNCLSDSVLTMNRFRGDIAKYNLISAEEYPPVLGPDGSIINQDETQESVLEATKPKSDIDIIVRIPMPRRSLIVLYGEARYHWEHSVLREDITSRRVCIAYREFTPPYLSYGKHEEIGNEIRKKAKQFWNHRYRYDIDDKVEKEVYTQKSLCEI